MVPALVYCVFQLMFAAITCVYPQLFKSDADAVI